MLEVPPREDDFAQMVTTSQRRQLMRERHKELRKRRHEDLEVVVSVQEAMRAGTPTASIDALEAASTVPPFRLHSTHTLIL
eukprot:1754622-Karenia_brevis.AAC.1